MSGDRHPLRAALAGTFWGLGHTLTLLLVGILVIVFKVSIPSGMALSLEFLAGAVLVALGAQILWGYFRVRFHRHSHGPGHSHLHFHAHDHEYDHHRPNHHRKSLLVGMVHGLAGSAALMLLVLSTIDSPWIGVAYILLFGLGSNLGMMIASTAIGLPFSLSALRFWRLNENARLLAGAVSVILGALVMVEIALALGRLHTA